MLRSREPADLFKTGAALTAAALLVGLFFLTRPLALRRENDLLACFNRLQEDGARLNEEIVRLHFNLTNNYDGVTAAGKRMQETVDDLLAGDAGSALRDDAASQRRLSEFDRRLRIRLDGIERFKTNDAVLKNSLIFLQRARADLVRSLSSAVAGHQTAVDALVEQVLLDHIGAAPLERERGERMIAALELDTVHLGIEVRARVDILVRHVREIERAHREADGQMRVLLGDWKDVRGIVEAYGRYRDRQLWKAGTYGSALLLVALFLLGYTRETFLRLRDKSRSLQLSASVIRNVNEGIMIVDRNGLILDVNPAFSSVSGYAREEVLGKSPRVLQSGRHHRPFYEAMWKSIDETGQWHGEIWNRRKNGEIYPEWLSITTVTDRGGAVTHYVGSCTDITERKQSETDIYKLAFHDPLTELPNRRLLMERLSHALAVGHRIGRRGAILFIDLDEFKIINDTRGHDVGDALLIEMAVRLRTCVRDGDSVARLGGDEFVVMLEDLSEVEEQAVTQAGLVSEKILSVVHQPCTVKGSEYQMTCSIGVSVFGASESNAEEQIQRADAAMYLAKRSGRNALCFFDPEMQAAMEGRMGVEVDLKRALKKEQLSLHYQMQVDQEGRIVGAEALLRWTHPERGVVPPDQFIPIAEEAGLIFPIDQWVLEQACRQIKMWEAEPHTRELQIAVNISARQFHRADFVERLTDVIARSGIVASRLRLEMTESVALGDVTDTREKMLAARELGVQLAMDDFGTGYSSLSYLTQLPFNQIKIDASFVRNIDRRPADAVIVQTIIGMAGTLGIDVIAEGVETQAQREFLRKAGCLLYQGYLFSKPVPLDGFEEQLRRCANA